MKLALADGFQDIRQRFGDFGALQFFLIGIGGQINDGNS